MSPVTAGQMSLPWWDDDVPVGETPGQGVAPTVPPAAPPGRPDVPDMSDRRILLTRPLSDLPSGEMQQTASGLAVFRHPLAQHEIRLGDALVGFELKRVRRRSIGMVVSPEGLSVRAPRWAGWGEIEQALQSKGRWICSKLADHKVRERRQEAARIDWREGASVPVLGEPAILVLDGRVQGARLNEDGQALPGVARKTLHVGLPQHATAEQIRDTVTAWLQRHALEVFEQRVKHFAQQLGVTVSRIRLSSARTRWGSASVDGSIRLHWRLIHFSPAIVDYVVAHELAHLREMNHSPRFWGVVASVLPEYDHAREQLRHAIIPD